jgi:hypothetical protein
MCPPTELEVYPGLSVYKYVAPTALALRGIDLVCKRSPRS